MKTQSDIITEVLVRNNRSTTDGFITDSTLKSWYVAAHSWAAAAHKWPFTEGRVSTTYTSTEEWNFEGYKADSFRMVQVGGKRLQKLNFEDYQIFKELSPSAADRVYTDYGRTMFINTAADVSGTLTAYGQYLPAIDTTDDTANSVFSNYDDEGNEAIVEKMTSYLKRREHLADEAELHDTRAMNKLNEVWGRIGDEQSLYQTHRDRGGMFKRLDVLEGLRNDEAFKRDQF